MSMSGTNADPRGDGDGTVVRGTDGRDTVSGTTGRGGGHRRHRSVGWDIAGIVGEILLGLGIICVLYVVWQLWWTGVDSARTQAAQEKTMSWTTPASSDGSYKIAKAQAGDPPVDTQPVEGAVIGQIYIPRFGANWKRLIVQGTTLAQLARHGMGHYDDTAMPGGIGNFSVAGHRAGYGEPLGNIDKLKNGDAFVIRTQNHWYIYTMTSHEIVLPTQTEVVAPVPGQPGATPTERLITLTTCEPRYTTPTHRWIVHGKLKYWANVSDGIPKELANTSSTGAITFTQAGQSAQSKIPPLTTLLMWTAIAFLVLFIAAAVAWGWPGLRRVDAQGRPVHHAVSLYGSIVRLMPGTTCVRVVEFLLLIAMAVMALFQWTFPWAAGNIPVLQVASNYVTV